MLQGLYIFVDDDFSTPIYADPDPTDLDESLWMAVCESVNDALEGDAKPDGGTVNDKSRIGWKTFLKTGLSFVAVVNNEIKAGQVDKFLQAVARMYMDEVDDIRHPDRDGVADVVMDVIPPWEEDED